MSQRNKRDPACILIFPSGGVWIRAALMLVLTVAWTGCQSPSQYTSPRVTGRVLDEQTRQPIKDVQVSRVSGNRAEMDPPKGAERLDQTPFVVTGADGEFALGSVRDLAFMRRMQWYSVTLSFTRRGYQRLVTTYSRSSSTNTSAGEPLVEAGDVLLKPLAR